MSRAGDDGSCGLSAESPLLVAMEVALFGRAGAGAAAPRLQTLLGVFGPPPAARAGGAGAPQMDAVQRLLTGVFFPPAVALPGGGFAAFAPHRFLGACASKDEALRNVAAYTEAACAEPTRDAPPLRAGGRSGLGGALGVTLKPIEWSLIALCCARHTKELPPGEPATLPASYVSRGALVLPRSKPPAEAIFSHFDDAKKAFVMFRLT